MKIKFIPTLLASCFSIITLVSCQSHEQKPDDAFEQYKEDKKLQDSDSVSKTITPIVNKEDLVKKNENVTEWEKFKMETEKKIRANEIRIKEIKSAPNANSKSLAKVARLEKDNNDLRTQLDEYDKEEKERWEKFTSKINQDVSEIGVELKEMSVGEKK